MFGRIMAMAAAICAVGSGLDADVSFPYQAYVGGQGTSVRSGPSNEHYATDFLSGSEAVEVYKHEGKWAAIRPPEGSFSWVPADQIAITDDPRIGKARTSNVSCRVGTRYSESHEVEFVRLTLGESVMILGREELQEDESTRGVWYKISPPAGEFRWVRLDAISTEPPLPSESDVQEDETQTVVETDESVTEEPAASLASEEAAAAESWTVVDESSRSSKRPEPSPTDDAQATIEQTQLLTESDGPSPPLPALLPTTTDNNTSSSESASAEGNKPSPGTTATTLSGGAIRPELLQHELLGVEWKLTETVVQPPAAWELATLRSRTQTIIDLSPNTQIRADAQRVLAKIAQFEDLQRRHLQLADAQGAGGGVTRPQAIANLLGGTMTAAGLSAEAGTRGDYAGTGWLMPLVTRREGMPRYALTDQDGNIMQFITPAPGINLNPYARKRIGVYGQRGFIPDLNKPHLMAERIISLDRVK